MHVISGRTTFSFVYNLASFMRTSLARYDRLTLFFLTYLFLLLCFFFIYNVHFCSLMYRYLLVLFQKFVHLLKINSTFFFSRTVFLVPCDVLFCFLLYSY
jgi:hypothetical protein